MLEGAHVPFVWFPTKQHKERIDGAKRKYVGTRYQGSRCTFNLERMKVKKQAKIMGQSDY